MDSHWFEGLGDRAQGFLLASLLFKKQDFMNLVSFLDESDVSALIMRAENISALERSQRVRLLVGQLKMSLYRSSQDWISAVHPSWLVAFLRDETPFIQQIALASLPPNVSRIVGKQLGIQAAADLPLSATILKAVRRAIEKRLVPMRSVRVGTTFSADLLLLLPKDELEKVLNHAGPECFAAFLQKESKELQKEIVQRLEYDVALKILGYIESGMDSGSDLYAVLCEMAENGSIDERFAKCLRPLD